MPIGNSCVLPDFDAELDRLRRTRPEQVLADLPPAVERRIRDDPVGAVHRIAGTMQQYWSCSLAPVWPRILALLEADVLWREPASGRWRAGLVRGSARHHHLAGDRLRAADPFNYQGMLSGEGLILVPSAMAWPRPARWSRRISRRLSTPLAASAPCGRPVGRLPRKHSAPSSAGRGRSCWLPSTRPGPPAALAGSSRCRPEQLVSTWRSSTPTDWSAAVGSTDPFCTGGHYGEMILSRELRTPQLGETREVGAA